MGTNVEQIAQALDTLQHDLAKVQKVLIVQVMLKALQQKTTDIGHRS